MCRELASLGAKIDGVYYCPHDEHPACNCRKPKPGMLFSAAGERYIDLSASWMIGDSEKDVRAGKSAGCRTARILQSQSNSDGSEDLLARSLLEAVHQILHMAKAGADRTEMGASQNDHPDVAAANGHPSL
jgi:D-glycero-D-manno-heptose 1,7-bisphosphate phosphatase